MLQQENLCCNLKQIVNWLLIVWDNFAHAEVSNHYFSKFNCGNIHFLFGRSHKWWLSSSVCLYYLYCLRFLLYFFMMQVSDNSHKTQKHVRISPRKYYDVKNDYLLEQRSTHQQRKSLVRADQEVCLSVVTFFLYFVCLFVIRRGTLEKGSSQLSSSVRPLVEPLPSEAVLDIKPEMDDDLIADEPLEISTNHSRTHGAASRHSADIYRPGQGQFTSVSSAEASFHARQQGSRTSRTSRTGSNKVLSECLFCSLSGDGVLGSWI